MKGIKQFLLLKIVLFYISGYSQQPSQNTISGLLLFKNNKFFEINLKDSVRSSRWFYSSLKADLPLTEKARIAYRNDIKQNFYDEFDSQGMLIKSIISSKNAFDMPVEESMMSFYNYDSKDLELKKSYKIKRAQAYPCYDYKQLVKVNYSNIDQSQNMLYYSYEYKYYADGKISEELEYNPYFEDNIIRPVNADDLYTKTLFYYDTRGNINRQKVIKGKAAEGMVYSIFDTETFCDDIEIKYEYDAQDRLTKVSLTGCKKLVFEEQYTYAADQDYITLVSKNINGQSRYPTQKVILHYNENGDITETNFVTEPSPGETGPPPRRVQDEPVNRYYEYEYDSHNNWIKCKLYLEGTKDGEPSAIAERKIEYYNSKL